MKFENAAKRRPKTPLLKMVPILIISATAIMSVAMAASTRIEGSPVLGCVDLLTDQRNE